MRASPSHGGPDARDRRSEVPEAPYPYRLRHHVDNLESLLRHLDLRGLTLVVHDWGGPVGLGAAVRCADRVARLVITNSWAFAPWPAGPLPRLLQTIRSERGERFVRERDGYVEPALRGTTHRAERLSPAVMAAYTAPFPTPRSRSALVCWSRDIPIGPEDASFPELKNIEERLTRFASLPVLIVWGMRDPVLTEPVLRLWQRTFPAAEVHELPDASHFLQEDEPEAVPRAIRGFLER